MRRKKTKIRVRILTVFSVMLLLSFSLIGVIFNIVARQYIQINAASQIDTTYENLQRIIEQAEIFAERQPDGAIVFLPPEDWLDSSLPRRNSLQIRANVFIVDDEYNLPDDREVSGDVHDIIQVLKDSETRFASLRYLLSKTDSGVYYISAYQVLDSLILGDNHLIVYADVTGLISFAATINMFFIVLICVMFVGTVIVTFFLSNTITRPIEKLGIFASKIGRGDFSPNDFSFKDEEFDKLNIALNNSAKQLSIYDSEQKAFFQNVSHELRTPLMSIQCQAEGISFDLMEPKKASETIIQEIQRLSNLVTDLLYISKIDNITTVYHAAKTDLLEIIRSCAWRQQPVAEKKGIRFLTNFNETTVEYECVGELISRAVENLISNAIRYASSEITLSCYKFPDYITINVTDDGCGIGPESMPHIFERFYKGNGGNHGIGLSIVKSIVEQHHGKITAKNIINGGAEFTIELPINKTG